MPGILMLFFWFSANMSNEQSPKFIEILKENNGQRGFDFSDSKSIVRIILIPWVVLMPFVLCTFLEDLWCYGGYTDIEIDSESLSLTACGRLVLLHDNGST
jgi:hypothetical protein